MNGALVITGGSRGIGRACAQLGAQAGWPICVAYRADRRSAETLMQDIEQSGGRAVAVMADVGLEGDVIRLFDRAAQAFGSIGGLINNAGMLAPAMRLADMDLARWNATIATNLTGTFLCAREAVRRMAAGGAIVNVSSMAAVLDAPDKFVDYAASKVVSMRRTGTAEEVARTILWLLSDAASYCTGIMVNVSGGR